VKTSGVNRLCGLSGMARCKQYQAKCSPRSRNPLTHVSFKVLAPKGKFRPDVTLINAVDPSSDRYDAIEEHRHPPSAAPEFQIDCIPGRRKISPRRTDAMSCIRPRIVQAKGYSSPRLEACEHPDLHPAAFGIEVPRQQDASLHNGKYILSTGHRPVYVSTRFAGMELSKSVPSGAIWESDNVLGDPARRRGTLP
jgi:hypothetical protein